jgi:hypothetical protein
MGYDDRCTGSADGRHDWVNNEPGHGADCSGCGATTAWPN